MIPCNTRIESGPTVSDTLFYIQENTYFLGSLGPQSNFSDNWIHVIVFYSFTYMSMFSENNNPVTFNIDYPKIKQHVAWIINIILLLGLLPLSKGFVF